jgi:class 3 adenylate cyclase/predicted ATPase
VLFCDLVGSTEIASRLDPEEWREIVGEYHRTAAQAIDRFGGRVAQYLGDGVMAYFGYPEAHDNDAERAARAGLAVLDAISKLDEQPGRPKLAARVGIDSGAVVVGAGAGREADVFGDTPNIAARVQTAAEPGTVVITDATHLLVSGHFVFEDRGSSALKGVDRPVRLYRVIQPSGVRGRLEAAAAAGGLTPFVGRENELGLLMNRWERVIDGEGQVAIIVGEAGIGKSRLVQRFHEQIAATPHTWVNTAAAQFFQNTPFYPVVENLRNIIAQRGEESAEQQLAHLAPRLKLAGLNLSEALPLLASLLGLPTPAKYPSSPLSPEEQRRRLLATLVEWSIGHARVQPLVITIEDLHWADASTLEMIQLLVEQVATARLLLLTTARPEFQVQWPTRAHLTQITLNRLRRRNAKKMIAQVAAQRVLPRETVELLVERSGGVPLFVEELTQAVLESDNPKLTGLEIPVTLHDSLMARLDRMGSAKEVAQLGAVIGGEFSYELLHAVHPIDEENLQRALRNLADAEMLYVRGSAPEASYLFKHALIRDAAYETLLRSRRKELHSRIAEVLLRQFPPRVTSAPELLAHHYTEAGLIPEAIIYWERAGQRASQRSAHAEAISHLTKALELLKTLPDTLGRVQHELTLQVALGAPLIATKGYAASEVEHAYARALELCQQLGTPPQFFSVLWGLSAFYGVRAELGTARELGERLLRLAQGVQDPALMLEAHHALGQYLFFLGEFSPAREHLEQGIDLYDPRQHGSLAFLYGQDPGMACLSYASWTLWFLGYVGQALERSGEALTLAQELSHPVSLAFALIFAAALRQLRREAHLSQERAEAAIALSNELGFQFWLTAGTFYRGWALAEQGQIEEGILQMRHGLDAFRATGAKLGQSYFLARLAEAYEKVGQADEGLNVLADALATVDNTGERFYEAELYRLKGELTLQQQSRLQSSEFKVASVQPLTPSNQAEAEAEAWFHKAIEIACKQQAKLLELRASASLARLWRQKGKRTEAHKLLSKIYGWFTEGFDTADLKEAKALLDQLNP